MYAYQKNTPCMRTTFLFLCLQFQDALYERALQCLPGSYKLWYSYLSTKSKRVSMIQHNLLLFFVYVEAIPTARPAHFMILQFIVPLVMPGDEAKYLVVKIQNHEQYI